MSIAEAEARLHDTASHKTPRDQYANRFMEIVHVTHEVRTRMGEQYFVIGVQTGDSHRGLRLY
ncbi:hypothetical protein J6590_034681 [Homalodisca vitripennis]|nr:hypothetical protein J6590_034681 [Homalodisca vitripennis]